MCHNSHKLSAPKGTFEGALAHEVRRIFFGEGHEEKCVLVSAYIPWRLRGRHKQEQAGIPRCHLQNCSYRLRERSRQLGPAQLTGTTFFTAAAQDSRPAPNGHAVQSEVRAT